VNLADPAGRRYDSPLKPSPNSKLPLPEEATMTLDRSLKVRAGAIKARNVLTRAERIAQLQKMDKFNEDENIIGMPKVRVMKVSLKKKKKVKKADDDKK
jgi:small basic protein (TIGR04137 family)